MKTHSLPRYFFQLCLHLFLLSACAAAAYAAAPASPERRGAQDEAATIAADLLSQGKAEAAWRIYSALAAVNPDDDAVTLGLARSAVGANRHKEAVAAYERLIARKPGVSALHQEVITPYMALGDRAGAERHVDILRGLDNSFTAQEGKTALDLMAGSTAPESLFQVHGTLRAGVMYDSNANQGPSSDNMTLGSWDNVIVRDAKSKETLAAYIGANLDLGRRFNPDSYWWLVGDVQFNWRGNANSALDRTHSRESQAGRAAVGVRRIGERSMVDLRVKAEVFDYDLYQNISAFGPEGSFVFAVTPNLHLITRAGLDRRVYSRDPGRNGAYGWVGQYARFFMGEARHEFLMGARYTEGNPKKSDYAYNGWEAVARMTVKMPYNVDLSPHLSYAEEHYNGPASALETADRRDQRWRAGLDLTWRITEAWSVEASYQYTANDSKSALYRYDQNMVSVGVAWNF